MRWFVLLISGLPEINTFTNNSVIQKILTSLVKINDFFFILHSTTINNETKNPPSRSLTDKTKRFNILDLCFSGVDQFFHILTGHITIVDRKFVNLSFEKGSSTNVFH